MGCQREVPALGTILVPAMLITPAATARLLTDRLITMMAMAIGIGALAGVTGLYASYYLNVALRGAIVLVPTAFFFLGWMFSPSYGVLGRHVRRSLAAGARSTG